MPSALLQRHHYALWVLVLLLAAWGRIVNIDAESLWVDEGFSYWAIRHPDMLGLLLRDVHPPFYFVLLRGWAQAAGITELALRYLSVLPSLLSVAALYHVGREVVLLSGGDARTSPVPLLAALLLALADMENYIAQETRMYTWHVLWVVLSMWAFLRWSRLGRARLLIPWGLATTLLLYTHYIGLCLVVVQGLYALLFLRGRGRVVAIAALACVGVVFIPWLVLVVAGQTGNIGTGFNVPSTLASLWNYRIEWFTGQWALMMGLALLGVYAALRPKRAAAFLMLAWLVIPVLLTYVLNFRVPILIDYRITQITPAVALLVAFGLGQFRGRVLAFLVAVIVVYGVMIDDVPRPRPPWREVGRNAAQYALPGDLALAHVTPSGDWQVMYYYERFMPHIERRSLRQWQLEDGATYAAGLPALLRQHDHVWFMHWSSDQSGFEALASTGHIQTAVMTEDWLGNDLNVYRFDVLPPQHEQIAAYTSGMLLRHAIVHPQAAGAVLRVDAFWSVEAALSVDYTVSAILLDENGLLVAQHDSPPFENQRPTSTWLPGEVIYDPHPLQSLNGAALPPGLYTVGLKVYQWTAQGITDMPTTTGAEYATLGIISLP